MEKKLRVFVRNFFTRKSKSLIGVICLSLFITGKYKAQDKIIYRDGTELECKVLEINDEVIEYKSSKNEGPKRVIDVSDVFMIQFENGTKEVFKEKSEVYTKPQAPSPAVEYNRNYDPDTSDFAKMRQKKFSGPRVGFTFLGNGTSSSYLQEENKRPNFVQFGWQFETVLFTAGSMSGLIEFVPLIGGFEQGLFVPSLNVLLGIRGGEKETIEFAIGPNFSVGRDYKQDVVGTVGVVVAVGTSFKKNKVNFPLTFAFVPSVGSKHDVITDATTGKTESQDFETGWKFSILVGFNSRKR